MAEIAWTPPGSYMGLGTILLRRQPEKALSPQEYRFALAERINRMVSRESRESALKLLEVMEENEKLLVVDNLAGVGELLAENSEWLRERAAYPQEPVPAPLKHDPEARRALKEEMLEEFLGILYHVSY